MEVLSAIVRQDSEFEPNQWQRKIIADTFDEGERPYQDWTFEERGTKVDVLEENSAPNKLKGRRSHS